MHCNQGEKTTRSEWEKIVSNEAIDKRLISKIYKQLIQPNIRKKKQKKPKKLIQKMGRRPTHTFLQRRNIDSQEIHEKVLNITHC